MCLFTRVTLGQAAAAGLPVIRKWVFGAARTMNKPTILFHHEQTAHRQKGRTETQVKLFEGAEHTAGR